MKKISGLHLIAVFLVMFSSCDKNYDELNTSKTGAITIDPAFQLNTATLNLSFGSPLVYELGIVQQVITPNSGVLTGANYNQDNRDATQLLWQAYYRNVIRNTRDVIKAARAQPDRSNLLNMARITQAYAFMVLTDTYGDIPYFQGGTGYTDQNFFPVYDAQKDIYADIIKELTEASAALSATGRLEPADIMYGGNISQWKMFGYSLLLRAGMRLSKVDPTQASAVAKVAFQGGVITSNANNAAVRHDNNYRNGIGNTLNSTEASNYYLAEPFVNYLKSTNDPRLMSIAVRYVGAKSGPEQTAARASFRPADQIGMPLGHNNATIVPVATSRGLASFYDFSQVDRNRLAKLTAPMFLVTAAQSQLLLAEARHRGWITTGSVQGYYEAGVTAHMEQMAVFDPASAVPAGAIQTYLMANPFSAATALQQINTQYWIASFLNGPEAFANFRRSGFPQLTPNPFPGKSISGDFIRRLTYPNSEISVNTTNVNAAIARMGPDNLDTRVWWDKP